jgi:hypothetical protein
MAPTQLAQGSEPSPCGYTRSSCTTGCAKCYVTSGGASRMGRRASPWGCLARGVVRVGRRSGEGPQPRGGGSGGRATGRRSYREAMEPRIQPGALGRPVEQVAAAHTVAVAMWRYESARSPAKQRLQGLVAAGGWILGQTDRAPVSGITAPGYCRGHRPRAGRRRRSWSPRPGRPSRSGTHVRPRRLPGDRLRARSAR